LLPGVMAQWLIDPDHAPSGRDLAEALRAIVADVGADRTRSGGLAVQDERPGEQAEGRR
jgi:hypothetical protein